MTDLSEEKGEIKPKENIQDNNDSSSETRLHISLGTQLQIQVNTGIGQDSTKLQSELVGIEYNKYLIVKLRNSSLRGNFQNVFYKGASLTMRCLLGGTIIGFRTSVLKVIYNPTLIFFEYPKAIEYQKIRSHQRVQCLLPSKISIDGNAYEVFTINISKSGCRVTAPPSSKVNSLSLEINKEISTSIQLPGVEGYLSMSGKLKYAKNNSGRMEYGIEFDAIEEGKKSQLFRYLSDIKVILTYL